MNSRRNTAIMKEVRRLHHDARHLERLSRHQPQVSRLAGEARRNLAAAEIQAEPGIDCALTSRTREDLLRLAADGDAEAFAELTRREPVAA